MRFLANMLVMVFSSAILLLLGTIYFTLTIWIIKLASKWAGMVADSNTTVLVAGIVTAASLIGSSIRR